MSIQCIVTLPNGDTNEFRVAENTTVKSLKELIDFEVESGSSHSYSLACQSASASKKLDPLTVEFVRLVNAHPTISKWVRNDEPIHLELCKSKVQKFWLDKFRPQCTRAKLVAKTLANAPTCSVAVPGTNAKICVQIETETIKDPVAQMSETLVATRDALNSMNLSQMKFVPSGGKRSTLSDNDVNAIVAKAMEAGQPNVDFDVVRSTRRRHLTALDVDDDDDDEEVLMELDDDDEEQGGDVIRRLIRENRELKHKLSMSQGVNADKRDRADSMEKADVFDALGGGSAVKNPCDSVPTDSLVRCSFSWNNNVQITVPVSKGTKCAELLADVITVAKGRALLSQSESESVVLCAPFDDPSALVMECLNEYEQDTVMLDFVCDASSSSSSSSGSVTRSKEQQLLNIRIADMLNRPSWMSQHDRQVNSFRGDVSRHLVDQFKSGRLTRNTGMVHLNTDILWESTIPSYFPKKLMFRFFFGDVTASAGCDPTDSLETLLSVAIKKLSKIQGFDANGHYIFKLTNANAFLEGDIELFKIKFVRNQIKSGAQFVDLCIVDRSSILCDESDQPDFQELSHNGGEQHLLQPMHQFIRASSMHVVEDMTCISMWDLHEPLRFVLHGIENVQLSSSDKLAFLMEEAKFGRPEWFVASVGVFHGGKELVEQQETSPVPVNSFSTTPNCPHFQHLVAFDLPLSDLPRATRVSITLWVMDEKNTRLPVAWMNMNLVDASHRLASGFVSLRMWGDGPANPIGTCVSNGSANDAAELLLEFPTYSLPVVFPQYNVCGKHSIPDNVPIVVEKHDRARMKRLVNADPTFVLSPEDCEMIFRYRFAIKSIPRALPKFLKAVKWSDPSQVLEAHRMMDIWEPLSAVEALDLLDATMADSKVRSLAVECLDDFSDCELEKFLMQIVQALKYEPYHDCDLARFLLRRALANRALIGHQLFWMLKSEVHQPEVEERFGLMLEVYVQFSGMHGKQLMEQVDTLNTLVEAACDVKDVPLSDRADVLRENLAHKSLPEQWTLPLNGSLSVGDLDLQRCKTMNSAKVPLWLTFKNASDMKFEEDVVVMVKQGDDLRQDKLTLSLMRIMEEIWLENDLDLDLTLYDCVATGDEEGMLKVVLNASTTAQISREEAGLKGAFLETPLANWLKEKNEGEEAYAQAVQRFIRSCAGYCVATYILGIGDRHNDNVMLKENGCLLHIDFGHFLGNVKSKFGFKRETSPFVLTPDFAYVMGGRDSEDFNEFVSLCGRAYNLLRQHAHLFFTLFSMMLSTGIPELQSVEDLDYLHEVFALELTDEEATDRFTQLIDESLENRRIQWNNWAHMVRRR
eukprot:TRINITY_DN484_c0_g1_i2.p1 TRINITY_DN484_c0_g1~~TRINITY_DN484_c0_g1_i2.p1  ORF type:complete len:1321 (+),score=469.87 TRINITY_DN484_c0_g1_i2:3-3965(+)